MADYSDLMKLEKKVKTPLPSVTSLLPNNSSDVPTSANLLANQQISKSASKQANLLANQLASKEANQQTSEEAKLQTSKQLKKFGSYLTEESIKSLKQIAVMTDRKDYEVLQDAVDFFLQHKDNR